MLQTEALERDQILSESSEQGGAEEVVAARLVQEIDPSSAQ